MCQAYPGGFVCLQRNLPSLAGSSALLTSVYGGDQSPTSLYVALVFRFRVPRVSGQPYYHTVQQDTFSISQYLPLRDCRVCPMALVCVQGIIFILCVWPVPSGVRIPLVYVQSYLEYTLVSQSSLRLDVHFGSFWNFHACGCACVLG